MYLKEIKAKGFKSFAEDMIITLDRKSTGIVGPNGSGKSNVVDAVRWVLGEQSVKSLRGEGNMTDVIFSGSKSRKSLGLASVTLVFDNKDHYLPIAYEEVSLKRMVYKDGTNEYYINGQKCRLKDLTDLLLDSGMAKESFNIISQGKIDEIILTKPSDRRVIFEEAAGVLKYKKRKEEALRKLEHVHDNMQRIEDIITELDDRLKPLEKQKEKALLYEKKYENMKNIDIALMANNINSIHIRYEENKEKIKKLNEEITLLSSTNSKSETKILEYKNKIETLDKNISDMNQNLIQITSKLEKINSEKTLLLERKKYEVDDHKMYQMMVEMKEQALSLENEIVILNNNIQNITHDMNRVENELRMIVKENEDTKKQKEKLEQSLYQKIKLKQKQNINIENLRQSIEENTNLPFGTKKILENKELKGIYNILGKVIEVEERYSTAISVSLGASASNIIVENEKSAKEAINFLKKNNFGRATFFPLNIIKAKKVDDEILKSVHIKKGFIDIASNLVQNEPIYNEIVRNQLGNVFVVDNIDNANIIHKEIGYRYKIVTLDGEVLHVGGTITGGRSKQKNTITDKYELEKLLLENKKLEKEISEVENEINEIDHKLKAIDDKYYLKNKERVTLKETIINKENTLKEKEEIIENLKSEISRNSKTLSNTLKEEENELISKYYEVEKGKQILESKLEEEIKERNLLKEKQNEFEFTMKRENALYNSKSKELNTLEISVNRDDVKLDTLLNELNETYNMTYENAILHYPLEMEKSEAEELLTNLKREIRDMGPVNTEAPKEYDEIKERYDFLTSQREDLIKAEDTLLEIIKEMDEVMKREFKESFETIRKNFKETFIELFHGGNADLKLTDGENLLETGIEIVASPPGKSLKSITLLSGGEKTFTAISLLFAILKSRPVPFCIFDEIEAALDEANVEAFGEHLQKLKEKTQFILITHKKKTMEYVDTLYGITMQESGVSKLVSVKLENIKK